MRERRHGMIVYQTPDIIPASAGCRRPKRFHRHRNVARTSIPGLHRRGVRMIQSNPSLEHATISAALMAIVTVQPRSRAQLDLEGARS